MSDFAPTALEPSIRQACASGWFDRLQRETAGVPRVGSIQVILFKSHRTTKEYPVEVIGIDQKHGLKVRYTGQHKGYQEIIPWDSVCERFVTNCRGLVGVMVDSGGVAHHKLVVSLRVRDKKALWTTCRKMYDFLWKNRDKIRFDLADPGRQGTLVLGPYQNDRLSIDRLDVVACGLNINPHCFYRCVKLLYVKIKAENIVINRGAFRGCKNLHTLEIKGSLFQLHAACLSNCSKLGQLTLPENQPRKLSLPPNFMYDNDKLDVWDVPRYIISLERGCFAYCYLQVVRLPPGVTYLGTRAFHSCPMLRDINLSDTAIQHIGPYAFAMCRCLMTIGDEYPKGLKYVGTKAFLNCSGLSAWFRTTAVPIALTLIGAEALYTNRSSRFGAFRGHDFTPYSRPFHAFTKAVVYTYAVGDGTVRTNAYLMYRRHWEDSIEGLKFTPQYLPPVQSP